MASEQQIKTMERSENVPQDAPQQQQQQQEEEAPSALDSSSSFETTQQRRGEVQERTGNALKAALDRYEQAKQRGTAATTTDEEVPAQKADERQDTTKAGGYTDAARQKMEQLKIGAKDYYNQGAKYTQETAESIKQGVHHKYNQGAEYVQGKTENAKEAAKLKYNQTAGYAGDKCNVGVNYTEDKVQGVKEGALNQYNQATDYAQQTAQSAKHASEEKYANTRDTTYDAINSAKQALQEKFSANKENNHQKMEDSKETGRDLTQRVEEKGGEVINGSIGKETNAYKDDVKKQLEKAHDLTARGGTQEVTDKASGNVGVHTANNEESDKVEPKGVFSSLGQSVSSMAECVKKAVVGE